MYFLMNFKSFPILFLEMYGIITTVNKARLGAVRWQNRARRSRDAVKEELRMKKRNRLTICLVAGVLILAVSATAAFGSVNGYSKYKEAVKALAHGNRQFHRQRNPENDL